MLQVRQLVKILSRVGPRKVSKFNLVEDLVSAKPSAIRSCFIINVVVF